MTKEPEPEDGPGERRSGIHPVVKLLLIVLVGIPVVLAVLALLVLGACFIAAS